MLRLCAHTAEDATQALRRSKAVGDVGGVGEWSRVGDCGVGEPRSGVHGVKQWMWGGQSQKKGDGAVET